MLSHNQMASLHSFLEGSQFLAEQCSIPEDQETPKEMLPAMQVLSRIYDALAASEASFVHSTQGKDPSETFVFELRKLLPREGA